MVSRFGNVSRRSGFREGTDTEVLLHTDEAAAERQLGLDRNPKPLVPHRYPQFMPTRHRQGMRRIGRAERTDEIEVTAVSVHPMPHLVVGKPVHARQIDGTAMAIAARGRAASMK